MRLAFSIRFMLIWFVGWHTAVVAREPVVARKPNTLRSYRFTAKIIYNGGVTPLKVGTKLTGEFTYDLAAPNVSKLTWNAGYRSARNKIELRYGELAFRSAEVVTVQVGVLRNRLESISLSAEKLKLPMGWRSRVDSASGNERSSISLSLYNQPARGALRDTTLPNRLDSWKRFSVRMVRLNYTNGVRFPGGQVDKQAIVLGQIESLEWIDPETVPRQKRP